MKCVCSLMTLAVVLAAVGFANAADKIEFNRDIRPNLSSNCFDCHGFDAKHRKAELRLDTLDGRPKGS